ncbi:MAG: S-adenosyl-L-homocysteine hydrolase [Sphingomonadales bacterium]|nr:S-adenosyl-L-homocysteine hydrolase [Sphingomonadales bacterium]
MAAKGAMARGAAGAAALLIAVLAMPVAAASQDEFVIGEKLRRLEMMLMVTSLRCRTGADDFQADYSAFKMRHAADLRAAADAIIAHFGARRGGGDIEFDRISVKMANQYGNGHPWLGCHELKGLTRTLAGKEGRAPLLEAADEVVDGDGPPQPEADPSAYAFAQSGR